MRNFPELWYRHISGWISGRLWTQYPCANESTKLCHSTLPHCNITKVSHTRPLLSHQGHKTIPFILPSFPYQGYLTFYSFPALLSSLPYSPKTSCPSFPSSSSLPHPLLLNYPYLIDLPVGLDEVHGEFSQRCLRGAATAEGGVPHVMGQVTINHRVAAYGEVVSGHGSRDLAQHTLTHWSGDNREVYN